MNSTVISNTDMYILTCDGDGRLDDDDEDDDGDYMTMMTAPSFLPKRN